MTAGTLLAMAVFVLFVALCVWGWQHLAASRQNRVNEAWLSLAGRTGLTYSPGPGPSLMGAWDEESAPRLMGHYRGHRVDMRLVSAWIDVYDSAAPIAYTAVSLQIRNRFRRRLSAGEMGILGKLFGKKKAAAEIGSPESKFRVKAYPPEFAQAASHLVEHLLRHRETEGINRNPFFWTAGGREPAVELQGSELTWRQYDLVCDPEELHALLDQLVDLAELNEKL